MKRLLFECQVYHRASADPRVGSQKSHERGSGSWEMDSEPLSTSDASGERCYFFWWVQSKVQPPNKCPPRFCLNIVSLVSRAQVIL